MKFEIQNFIANLADEMRSAGYHYEGQDSQTRELKFYQSVSSGPFPRFHIYGSFDGQKKVLYLNLHLDQKAPVYQGAAAHAGDYEGEVIEKEAARIKAKLAGQSPPKIKLDL